MNNRFEHRRPARKSDTPRPHSRPGRKFDREETPREERPRRSYRTSDREEKSHDERPRRNAPAWRPPEKHLRPVKQENSSKTRQLDARKQASQLNTLHEAARDVLNGVFTRQLPPDLLLAEFFRNHHQCGSRDRALLSSAIYALMRYWGYLRCLIPADWRQGTESGSIAFPRRELGALLCGALYCDNPYNEAVKLLSSFYDLPPLPFPAPEEILERGQAAAVLFGGKGELHANDLLPQWIASRIPDADTVASALGKRPPLWLRIHRNLEECLAEFRSKGLPFELFEAIPGAVALYAPRLNLFSLEGYSTGCYEVQDLASQAIGTVCGVHPGERVLDACAGAGGKTLQLASLMRSKGVIIAGDVRENKLEELRRRARRAGLSNIHTRPHTGKLWREFKPCDRVLLDVPCSGSGVWRRNPGLQWCFTEAMLKEYVQVQSEILEHFCPAVKPGGRLIYSTCSLFPEENEMQVQAFLEKHPEFTLVSLPHPITGRTGEGLFRFAPVNCDCDFMFAAVMERSAR